MKAFLEPLRGLAHFEELEKALSGEPAVYAVSGCIDAQKPQMIYGLNRGAHTSRLVVAPGEQRARELLEACRFFDPDVLYFPARDILFYQSDIRGTALTGERMRVYRALAEGESPTVVTTFDALMDRLVPPRVMESFLLHFRAGDTADPEEIRKKLVLMGYEYNHLAEEPGQFSARGGILDVFPLTEEVPYRVEFWGDEVDSIRSFSPASQRSLETAEELTIYPASELVLDPARMETGIRAMESDCEKLYQQFRKEMKTEEAFRVRQMTEAIREQLRELSSVRRAESCLLYFYGETVCFLEYFSCCADARGERALVFLDEPTRCMERGRAAQQEFSSGMRQRLEKGYVLPGQADVLTDATATAVAFSRMHTVLLSSLEMKSSDFSPKRSWFFHTVSVNTYQGRFSYLVKDLKAYKNEKYGVILLCSSRTRARRMAGELRDEGLTAFFSEDEDRVAAAGEVMVRPGMLKKGFACPEIRFVVLTETDIFGAEKKVRKKKAFREGERITGSDALKPGDYVIHANHGLGVFRGIEKVEINKTRRDFMKIEYDRGGVLYVPAAQLDLIQKYAGADTKQPKLNRLGGSEWKRTKSRVKTAVQEIARDLVDLYAVRQNSSGYSYGADTVWQTEFEEMFPFEETEDQLQAIRDVKADMESTKIMDRLICGDVGFGKTEVAIRAAFKAVQENRQVVYLVPTTILAQQHYNNFVQRLKDFPVNVELLCRFRTQAQQRETVKRLRQGLTDIVIGTHRVLSKDVEYKDLGLLVIDEEQRFGVSHKEKIKKMKKTVDVLSLTATPIPRTLHMSLIGIRDMSVLEEPPRDRMPIQTYIMEYSEEMVREAIERELAREGQIYYVYNRVQNIAEVSARIARLVPDAEVAFAHGQMSERELENVMYRFINGEINVLVSTTIIETGLDIGNVNTMIIHDADRMGLAQLYQLRGRIGRSSRTAYAFLMYRRDKILREEAEKRLSAIREFTELGSGIRIAMKDLEIRGAGNLLGEQQHGHMEAVGYDLYCRMLNEAVRTAKGEAAEESFETVIDIETDAWIPPAYIEDEIQKLDIYKRIAAIRTIRERDEMLDELIDRFGEPPRSVQNLLTAALMREQAHRFFLTEIRGKSEEIIFYLYEKAQLDPAKIPDLVKMMQPRLRFVPDKNRPYFIYDLTRGSKQKTGLDAVAAVQTVLEGFEVVFGESR
ncbi:MAG: transcription-repair coupling factor [Clostridiales bacterium]|nr:transcription-repair coupling factor [Clostridiales bacterium]